MYVLGVDFGGGASKATLLDERGKVVATATAEYPTFFRPRDGWLRYNYICLTASYIACAVIFCYAKCYSPTASLWQI